MVASKDTEQDAEKDMIETNAELVERAISELEIKADKPNPMRL